MMSHNQNPHRIGDDAKQKMVREAMQVDAAKIALADRKRAGFRRGLQHQTPQLVVKIVRKLRSRDPLIVLHDGVDIGVNL